jgi:sulfide:quinone oxidoreductase
VVPGGGTGGTLIANRLRRQLGDDDVITVVDRDGQHAYQPGLLFVPFGRVQADRLTRPRARQLHGLIGYHQSGASHVDIDARRVHLEDGTVLPYDVLVIASGAALLPNETDGLADATERGRAFTFYDREGAVALRDARRDSTAGGSRSTSSTCRSSARSPRSNSASSPTRTSAGGIRDRVELTLVTPLDGAFTKAVCNRELSGMLAEKAIDVVTEFNTGEVDADGGRLISFDGR